MTNRVDYDLNSSIETSTASVRRGQAFLKTLAEAESALFSDHAENSISFLVPPTKRAQRKLHLESNEESTMFNTTIESTISEFSTASHVKSIDKRFQGGGLPYDREYELRRELKKKDGEILHARMFNKTLQEHLAANETNLDVLQRNLEKVAQKDRESGSKILQLEGYIHSRDEQFSELQAKYQTLKACFDEMMESATAKQHELQAKVASEVKKGSELADSIGRLQTEVDGLRRKEEMLERERDELLKDVEEMKVEMSKLEQACSGERRKLEERDEELAERKEALRTLHASCDEQALKLQYHDEIEATMGARIEELKEALRIQEQELREVRRESGAAMRKAFANFDAFLVQHVVKMQRHRVAHLMFLTWALSAKSKVLRMGHFLKSLQRKVSAHDVMKISFNAMRPESRTSLMKVVVKGQEKSIMAASFSEWRKRVKNLNVMKRIGVNFVSYNLQVILRGWKRLCKARKMSQSALMASRAGLLQSAFCQLKSIVSTKNLWRKKEMALSSKRMRMTVVEMFASWLHVKDSEKKLKNLLLRWNMGQGVSCSRRYFSMWSHAIYSQISFSNRLKRAAFMRSKFSLITVRTMMAAWRRHVGILVKCRRSFKERMRGDVGVCFEKLSVNAQEMKEGRLRLQNLRMRKGQNQLKVLFGGWKDHLFEMQHRLNIMARTLSLVFQKHLQLSFQTWAAVTSMSRRHLVAQSKINDRSSRSCLKFHFSSLARHARTIGLRRRKVQALFSRILLRLLATLTSSWRTLMTRSKVCRKKSSDMMVAKSVRMKNFAFHTLLGFADDKVKARHVCDKVERVRRRGLQVLCWLSLSKKVADSRVMFSRLEAMKMRRLFAGWRKSILFIKMCCEVKFNVTSSLSAKRKLLYRHLTGWREVRGVNAAVRRMRRLGETRQVLLSFRAMYHVMVVEKQNKSQEVLMSKKEKDRQAFLSVLLVRWYRHCSRLRNICQQINDPQQSSKVNLGMSAFACWLATFHRARRVRRGAVRARQRRDMLAKRASFMRWLEEAMMTRRFKKLSRRGRTRAGLRCLTSCMRAWGCRTLRSQTTIIACLRYVSRRRLRARQSVLRAWRTLALVELRRRLSTECDHSLSARRLNVFMTWKLTLFANKTFRKLDKIVARSNRRSMLKTHLQSWGVETQFCLVRSSNKHFFSSHHENDRKRFIYFHFKIFAAHARAARSSLHLSSILLQLRKRSLTRLFFISMRLFATMMRRRNEFSIHNLSIIEPNRKIHRTFRLWKDFTDQRLMMKFVSSANEVKQKYHDAQQDCSRKDAAIESMKEDCMQQLLLKDREIDNYKRVIADFNTDADGLDEKMKLLLKHLNDREQKLVRELQESKAELVKSISAHNSTIAELQKEKKKGDALELQNIVLQKEKDVMSFSCQDALQSAADHLRTTKLTQTKRTSGADVQTYKSDRADMSTITSLANDSPSLSTIFRESANVPTRLQSQDALVNLPLRLSARELNARRSLRFDQRRS